MCAKIKTFENLFWMHVSTSVKIRRWHFVSLRSKSLRFQVRMVLCPGLSLLLLLKTPTWRLSSVLISVLKLPQSQEERTPSLPLKTKQPLPSTPSCMEGVLTWQWLTWLILLILPMHLVFDVQHYTFQMGCGFKTPSACR